MAARTYESPTDATPAGMSQELSRAGTAVEPRTVTDRVPAPADVVDGDYGQLLAEFRSGQELLREAEVRFKMLVETIPGVAYIAEPGEHGAWLYISPRLEQLLGYPAEEWIAEPARWIDLIHPDDRTQVIEDEAGWTETTGGVHVGEYRLRASDGAYRWIRDAATAKPGDEGGKPLWFGVLSDITESRDAQEALRSSEQLLRSVLETARDAFVAVDDAGSVLEWNRRAESMFGRRREDVLGHQLIDLIVPTLLRERNPFALLGADAATPADSLGTTMEMIARHADGSEFPTELTLWPTTTGMSDRHNVFIRDITERNHLQDELRAMAFSDALTGLANRAFFCDRLALALARRNPAAGALVVLFLDVDDFKTINDRLGHAAGDQLLSIISERLLSCVRPGDTVARFAGDEFALLLPEVADLAHAEAVTDRIGRALREPLMLEGRKTVISASIGISSCTASRTVGLADMLREADAAMYHAKRSGKNTCVVFDPGMHATALARLELQKDLALAVDREEFFLNFQPYFDLVDGRLVGFEALVRWAHPTRALISPLQFIPLAEETGLIHPIGDWVLHEACRQARVWQGDGHADAAPNINVNVSALQIQEPGLVAKIAAALLASELDPGRLVLEITEGVLLRRVAETVVVLQELRTLGVRIAIDDFGTGFSSLSYLQDLPIDMIKIDKSFVDHLGLDRDESSMAKVIVSIGQTLQLATVAEGVERQEQVESLQALGCDSVQGFHLGRPMSEQAAFELAAAAAPPAKPSGKPAAKPSGK
jgi:diguanylate cyclase (GGDEF)-like protein/PAS domain S-box-containing protein